MGGPACGGGAATTSLAARTGGPLERQSCVQGAPAPGGPAGMRWHEFSDNLLCANPGTTAALIAGGLRAGGPWQAGRARRLAENFESEVRTGAGFVPARHVLRVELAAGAWRPPPHPLPSRVPCGLFFLCARMPNKQFCAAPCGPLARRRVRSIRPSPLDCGAKGGGVAVPCVLSVPAKLPWLSYAERTIVLGTQ